LALLSGVFLYVLRAFLAGSVPLALSFPRLGCGPVCSPCLRRYDRLFFIMGENVLSCRPLVFFVSLVFAQDLGVVLSPVFLVFFVLCAPGFLRVRTEPVFFSLDVRGPGKRRGRCVILPLCCFLGPGSLGIVPRIESTEFSSNRGGRHFAMLQVAPFPH